MEENHLLILPKEEILKSSLASEYVKRANDILLEQMQATIAEIEAGKEKIQKIVDVLVKQNHLTGAEFDKLMKENGCST